MKVFYWTEPFADQGRRMWQIDLGSGNFAAEVPAYNVGPDMLKAMLEDGFIEISPTTAYKMGLPT